MNTLMRASDQRANARQSRNWTQFGTQPGIRRLRGDPALWPVVPVRPRWLSMRCGFDVRFPQLDELSARYDALKDAYDAYVRDMDARGRRWTRDIRDNSQMARENAQAVQQAEQDSVARDVQLGGMIAEVEDGSLTRDAGLSSAIDDVQPVQPIDYTPYFERIISAQHDYRPLLSSVIQAQERAERRLDEIADNTGTDYAPYFERIISTQTDYDYRPWLDVIVANQ